MRCITVLAECDANVLNRSIGVQQPPADDTDFGPR
jgi:hypothetical protein